MPEGRFHSLEVTENIKKVAGHSITFAGKYLDKSVMVGVGGRVSF